MANLDQLNSDFAPKLGIQTQYLDGEGHFVTDALSGAVAAGEQFEVGEFVVRAISVDVVDGFLLRELSANVAGHDVAVFENSTFLACHPSGYRNPEVAVTLDVGGVFPAVVSFGRSLDFPLLPALDTAVFLLPIDGLRARPTQLEELLAAVKTDGFIAHIPSLFAASGRALDRAVHRIFVVLLSVGINKATVHGERLLAFLTGKFYRRQTLDLPAVDFLPRVEAILFAKTLLGIARSNGKRLTALFTYLVDRHFKPLVVGALQNRANNALVCGVGQHF